MSQPDNLRYLADFQQNRVTADQLGSRPLNAGGGGGNSDGMEARVAKLEAHVEHIRADIGEMRTAVAGLRSDARTDFRLLFGALITVALGLGGLLAKGFHWF